MALESEMTFYLGLGCLIIGNGLFKPNISSIVGQLYTKNPEKKDAAYTIFYMGINAGAFLGILLCGYIGEKIDWSYGFGLAGVFMLFGLLQFSFAQNHEQTILNLYAAVDAGEFDKAAAYMTDDVKVSLPFSPQVLDKTVYKQIGSSTIAGFPDSKHTVLEVVSGKKSAAFKAVFYGTNTASLQGNPPTGNRVELPFLGYMKFDKKGKITNLDIQFDVGRSRRER